MQAAPSYPVFAYGSRVKSLRIPRSISNPFSNSFSKVEVMAEVINATSMLPEPVYLDLEDRELSEMDPEDRAEYALSYPPCPSFLVSPEDIARFKFVADDIVMQARSFSHKSLDKDIATVGGDDAMMEEKLLCDKEKELYESMLQRMDYERHRVEEETKETNPEVEQTMFTSNGMSTEGEQMVSKCISDCLSSHFHDLLNPKAFVLDDFPFSDHPMDTFSPSLPDTLPPFTEQDLLHPFMANLNEAIISSVKQRPPREPEPSVVPLAVKPVPPLKGSVMLHYYEKAKEAERKHLNPLPSLLSTTVEDSPISPVSYASHASSRSASMSDTSRKSSFSGTVDLSSVHQGELLILLQKISSLPNGVKRVNELQKQSREYSQKQQALRQARRESGESIVWNNAMDYISPEEEMEFSYRPMVSMRLEYSSSESTMQEIVPSDVSTPSSSIPAPRLRSGVMSASRSNYPSFRVTLNSSLSTPGVRLDPLSLQSELRGEVLKESDQESSLTSLSNPSRRSPSSMEHSVRFSSQSIEESVRRSLQQTSNSAHILHQSQPLPSRDAGVPSPTNVAISGSHTDSESHPNDQNNESHREHNEDPNNGQSQNHPHSSHSTSTSVPSTPHSPASLRGRSQTSSPRPCSSEASQRAQNRFMAPPAGMHVTVSPKSLYTAIEMGKKHRPRVFSQQLRRLETRPSEMPRVQDERRTTLFPNDSRAAVPSRDSLLDESESPIPVDDDTSQHSLTNMSLDLGEPEGPVHVTQEQERPLSSYSAFSRSRRNLMMSQNREAPSRETSSHSDVQRIVIPERSQSDVIHPSASLETEDRRPSENYKALDKETVNELEELFRDDPLGELF